MNECINGETRRKGCVKSDRRGETAILETKRESKMVCNGCNRDSMGDIIVIVGLITVQFMYAGNSILLSYFLKLGLQSFDLIIFANFAMFLMLSPLAVIFERRKWPERITYKLVLQLLLISFAGVTLYQSLYMKGVNLTSPAIATAMPNLAPGLIFLIAWAFRYIELGYLRLEKIKLGCWYSRAKIAGTLLCVFGAVVMSLIQSAIHGYTSNSIEVPLPYTLFDQKMIIGCLYLIAAIFVMSSQSVLQAVTLTDFPAPISMCATTSIFGVAITAIVQMLGDNMQPPKWPTAAVQELILYSIWTGIFGGMCLSFNTWAMKRRGPVMVSIFNPLSAVISAIFSHISLGESFAMGSIAGMCLMFIGLYMVLWAKKKEGYSGDATSDSPESRYDVEKPLLC